VGGLFDKAVVRLVKQAARAPGSIRGGLPGHSLHTQGEAPPPVTPGAGLPELMRQTRHK